MRLFHLVAKKHWLHKSDRYRFIAADKMDCQRTGVGWLAWDESKTAEDNFSHSFGAIPDVVICYKPGDHPLGLADLDSFRVLTYNEMFNEDRVAEDMNFTEPHLVVCHHVNDWKRWEGLRRKAEMDCVRFIHLPHCHDERIFYFERDKPDLREIDFCLVGKINNGVYPLREKLRKVMLSLSERYRCYIHPHCGFELAGANWNLHLLRFAEVLRRSRIVCTCSSKYRYRLSKYAEVPACGAVLAADLPERMPQDDMEEHMIVLDPSWPEDKIERTLVSALKYKAGLRKKRDLGLRYAQRFTMGCYTENLKRGIDHARSSCRCGV